MFGGSSGRRRRVFVVGAVACVALAAAGCAGSGGSEEQGGEVERLRAENERLQSENERLRSENEDLQSSVEEVSPEASSPEKAEGASSEPSEPEPSDEGGSGGSVAVAGPGDLSGEEVPGIVPEDFPLPAGAVFEYTNESEYNFSLQFVLDKDLESMTAFYEEQLKANGWEETDRTEYEQDGLKGEETSWEKGKFIPKESPQDDPNYEQTDQTLSLTLQEIQPSGIGGRIFWSSNKLLNETT